MFSVREVKTPGGIVQYRRETLTGLRCRISTERIKRGIDAIFQMDNSAEGCPFCPDRVLEITPTFEDGSRIIIGESVTFPNLFPFADRHTVTVITRSHMVEQFSRRQLTDAFRGQIASLQNYDGYPSINWNHLPSAGASIVHPHMQGIADALPTALAERYILESSHYHLGNGRLYRDVLLEKELASERYLFGDEIPWIANAVPLGEREVRGYLPIKSISELEPYLDVLADGILNIIDLYRRMGSIAFNASLFFDKTGCETGFRSFLSMVARINPNPQSMGDSAFMERLHLEPIILTLPEDLANWYHKTR